MMMMMMMMMMMLKMKIQVEDEDVVDDLFWTRQIPRIVNISSRVCAGNHSFTGRQHYHPSSIFHPPSPHFIL